MCPASGITRPPPVNDSVTPTRGGRLVLVSKKKNSAPPVYSGGLGPPRAGFMRHISDNLLHLNS